MCGLQQSPRRGGRACSKLFLAGHPGPARLRRAVSALLSTPGSVFPNHTMTMETTLVAPGTEQWARPCQFALPAMDRRRCDASIRKTKAHTAPTPYVYIVFLDMNILLYRLEKISARFGSLVFGTQSPFGTVCSVPIDM